MEISKTCGVCFKRLANSIVTLPKCGHKYHLECFSHHLEYNDDAKRVSKEQRCMVCYTEFTPITCQTQHFMKHNSHIYFYENILKIPRLQCRSTIHNGMRCENYEYPFNNGYCKKHYRSSFNHYDRNKTDMILNLFDVLLMNKYIRTDKTFRLKMYMFIIFYSKYTRIHSELFEIFSKLMEDFTKKINSNHSLPEVYKSNNIEYPRNELDTISFYIK